MSRWFFAPKRASPLAQPTQRSPSQSLLHYETGSPPPSARVDPKLKLQPRRPLRLWDYCKFGVIVAAKATEVTSDILLHHIWGPRRKSWGIEMTIITSLIRGADRHSALVDIGTIRMLMSIGRIVPLPSDALISPVTFRVKQRNLRGILSAFDAKENGKRELCGEWVVGLKTWQRMQTDWKAARNPNKPDAAPTEYLTRKERVILYIHGGAYYLSSAAAQRIISIPLAKYTESRVFALDYRLAPETCFPGPLHDVVSAYFRLVDELHIPPENIIVSGDSAGGGLCLALLMYLRDNQYPLPSGAILMSPWVDLTMSCESWESNASYDVVPIPTADNHMNPIALYLGERTEEYLTHPYASPLFGDFKGLPPLLVHAGDAEVLRDEIALMAHKATLAGVEVMHEVYEDAIHVFQAYPFLDASRRSFESMRNFVRVTLPRCQSRSPQLLADIAKRGLEREIGGDRLLVVDGDGSESSVSYDLRNHESHSTEDYNSNETEDGRSWIRNPYHSFSSWIPDPQLKGKMVYEHTENADVDGIPYLSLAPPFSSNRSHENEASSSVGSNCPTLSTAPSDESTTSSSSFTTAKSNHTPRASPRRIQSTSSLLPFFSKPQSDPSDNGNMHDSAPRQRFSLDLFKHSLVSQSRGHTGTQASLLTPIPASDNAVPSPTIRKRGLSLGLAMSSKQMNTTSKGISQSENASPDIQFKSAARTSVTMGDVRKIVDEWTKFGPANRTVVVSAHHCGIGAEDLELLT